MRAMNEISPLLVRAALDMSAANGLPVDTLVAGLPFDAASVRRMKRARWDDYCVLIERMEVAAGGPARFEDMLAKSYHQAMPPEVRTVLGAFVSLKLLYRFLYAVVNPAVFPNVEFGVEDLDGNRLRLSSRFRSHARPSAAVCRASVGGARGVPGHLGLPMVEVEVEELTDRALVCVVRLPESRTLLARAQRQSTAALRSAAVRLLGQLSVESRATSDRVVAAEQHIADLGALGRELAQKTDLPSLFAALVGMLGKLGWRRVVLAVVPLDPSEAEWIASDGEDPPARRFALANADREIGRLEVGGTGDPRLLEGLVPWLSIAIDNARTFGALARPRGRDEQPRIVELQRKLELTARQGEVLACVARGLSNKEIAVELDCTEANVEFHVTHLLRKARVHSRTQLIARFWAGGLP
jgi:DNA-binding CsgD family transcriptional regulator